MRTFVALIVFVGPLTVFAACSANSDSAGFGEVGGSDDGAGGGAPTTSGNGLGGDLGLGGGLGSGGAANNCDSAADEDKDKDGWTKTDGDCNDCDANVNPGAVEVVAEDPLAEKADEDCDGMPDNVPECDSGLAIDEADPMKAVQALDLCKQAVQPNEWGVVSAKWVMPDGSPENPSPNFHLGHGVLSAFGPNVNVQGGKKMLALSSGAARQPTDPGYMDVGGFDKLFTSGSPQGFPKESPACATITGQPHDGVGLEVVIRVPSNAKGFSFDFNFYTYEWPGWVCTQYNDFFVALLTPIPMGQMDGNISFDSLGNPVSVNNAFVEVCGCDAGPPCNAGTKTYTCALGDTELLGTGFGKDPPGYSDHAATSWLVTTAPADPSTEITMRWTVYDSGDGVLDSTTLIDNWQWSAEPGTIGTVPIRDPK